MIRINIKNVASYGSNTVQIETDKKINLFYGLNGSGKTTISEFFRQPNHFNFSECSIDGLSNEKIFVYNQKFISENFYEKNKLKGIFTLSEHNKVIEEQIKNLENDITDLKNQKKDINTSIEEFNTENKQYYDQILNEVWKIKDIYYGGDRVLEFCLQGFIGKKVNLLEKIINCKLVEIDKSIEELHQEANSLLNDDAEKIPNLEEIKINFNEFEDDSIFSEIIIGNDNSFISSLIHELNNDDWVSKGRIYLHEDGICPFCQENTITKEFIDSLNLYFDTSYTQKLEQLEQLKQSYKKKSIEVKIILDEYNKNKIIKQCENEFNQFASSFTCKVDRNIEKIIEKIKEPSKKIALEKTKSEFDNLNSFIISKDSEIQIYNNAIENKQSTKDRIQHEFWNILRKKYNTEIEIYLSNKKRIKDNISKLNDEINSIKSAIDMKLNEISILKSNISNIETSVEDINKGLIKLGIDNFKLSKIDKTSYQIIRDDTDENQFRTLSEGEKTIISFLYFIQLCNGLEYEKEIIEDRLIVIDDPISSLTHIFIFNLCQIIKENFFKPEPGCNIFIFTHNLYFLHELIKLSKKGQRKLFRIIKNVNSNIFEMDDSEIQNEYQSYWQILLDHDNGYQSDVILANTMRNILEHFFAFIDKSEKLNNIFDDLDPVKYGAFLRFINRESHSDSVNISDFKEIDCRIFKEAFKEVFVLSGFEDHYNKMMNIV